MSDGCLNPCDVELEDMEYDSILTRFEDDVWCEEDWIILNDISECLDPKGRYSLLIEGQFHNIVSVDPGDDGAPVTYYLRLRGQEPRPLTYQPFAP